MGQANHEDAILQAYRSLILTVHSIVLAGAAALTGAAFQVLGQAAHLNLLSSAVSVAAIFSALALRRAELMLEIKEREVSFLHRLILEAEKSLCVDDQFFTKYKQFQEHNHSLESADAFNHKVQEQRPFDPRDRVPFLFKKHSQRSQSKRRAIRWQFKLIVIMWLILLVCTILASYFVN